MHDPKSAIGRVDGQRLFQHKFLDTSRIKPEQLIFPKRVQQLVDDTLFTPLLYTEAVRAATRDGRPCVEFTWEGSDEGDQVSGRGFSTLTDEGTLDGRIFFHLGDDSAFQALPEKTQPAVKGSPRRRR